MLSFKRAYIISASISGANIGLSVIGSISSGQSIWYSVVSLSAAAVALFPIFWRGGVLANPRLAIGVAAIFTIATGSILILGFLEFVRTRGGEGPHGEGSPLANIIAMTFFGAFFLCPWLLTTLRGLPHWKTREPS